VSILQDDKEEMIYFYCESNGYNFEAANFNHLLHSGKKENDLMNFLFSKNLMKTLDAVREVIGLAY
jgi:hypothetical protein